MKRREGIACAHVARANAKATAINLIILYSHVEPSRDFLEGDDDHGFCSATTIIN
jgi:hypothetical protein